MPSKNVSHDLAVNSSRPCQCGLICKKGAIWFAQPHKRGYKASMITILTRIMRISAMLPIWLYRAFISPLLPPACRFVPTCSEYGLQAIAHHGAFVGLWLALRRILRCHPLRGLGGGAGYDPVPGVTHCVHPPKDKVPKDKVPKDRVPKDKAPKERAPKERAS